MQDSRRSGDMEMNMVRDKHLTNSKKKSEFLVHRSKTSKRSPEVMDHPDIVTIDSKLLRDLSTYLILISTSPIEIFRAEIFNKVAGILDKQTKIPLEIEDGWLDVATYKDARRVTQELLLRIQSRIASGTLVLTQALSDDAMQSVGSDLFRLFEDKSTTNRDNQPIYPIVINASTIENFRVEVFNKVFSAIDTHGVCPSANESLDETTMEARLQEARRITRDVLLEFQSSIATGNLIFTADTKDLTDDAMQAVISDALRALEENLIIPEPNDGHECVPQRRRGRRTKAVKRFFRRTWQRVKNTFTSCLCIRAQEN